MANNLFTEPAEYELIDIEHYIHVHSCNLIAAIRIVDCVMNKAHSLAYDSSCIKSRVNSLVNLQWNRYNKKKGCKEMISCRISNLFQIYGITQRF